MLRLETLSNEGLKELITSCGVYVAPEFDDRKMLESLAQAAARSAKLEVYSPDIHIGGRASKSFSDGLDMSLFSKLLKSNDKENRIDQMGVEIKHIRERMVDLESGLSSSPAVLNEVQDRLNTLENQMKKIMKLPKSLENYMQEFEARIFTHLSDHQESITESWELNGLLQKALNIQEKRQNSTLFTPARPVISPNRFSQNLMTQPAPDFSHSTPGGFHFSMNSTTRSTSATSDSPDFFSKKRKRPKSRRRSISPESKRDEPMPKQDHEPSFEPQTKPDSPKTSLQEMQRDEVSQHPKGMISEGTQETDFPAPQAFAPTPTEPASYPPQTMNQSRSRENYPHDPFYQAPYQQQQDAFKITPRSAAPPQTHSPRSAAYQTPQAKSDVYNSHTSDVYTPHNRRPQYQETETTPVYTNQREQAPEAQFYREMLNRKDPTKPHSCHSSLSSTQPSSHQPFRNQNQGRVQQPKIVTITEVNAQNLVEITNGSEAIKELPAPVDPMLMEFQALLEEGELSDELPEKLTPKKKPPRPARVSQSQPARPATVPPNSRTRKSVSPSPTIPMERSPSNSSDGHDEWSKDWNQAWEGVSPSLVNEQKGKELLKIGGMVFQPMIRGWFKQAIHGRFKTSYDKKFLILSDWNLLIGSQAEFSVETAVGAVNYYGFAALSLSVIREVTFSKRLKHTLVIKTEDGSGKTDKLKFKAPNAEIGRQWLIRLHNAIRALHKLCSIPIVRLSPSPENNAVWAPLQI